MSKCINPTNQDDVIDSRDIIERIEDLREIEAINTADDFSEAEQDELDALLAVFGDCNGLSDWELAAAQLERDYTTTEFDGVTYYIRNC